MAQVSYPSVNLKRARRMRKQPTEAERKLWRLLRDRRLAALKFRRQVPIGPYIADFLCQNPRVVIELDGSQHAENERDIKRDRWFELAGYRVLRYWNNEVLSKPDDVVADIFAKLAACAPFSP